MKRKICAVLLVLGMILCQVPQNVAAAEDTQTDGESGTSDSISTQGSDGDVEAAGSESQQKEAVSSDGEMSKDSASEPGTEQTRMPAASAGTNANLVGASSTPRPVRTVIVGVSVPYAGDSTSTAPGVFALGSGYHVTTANWCDEDGNDLGSAVTFVAGETYYMKACIDSNEGYAFPQGSDGTTFEAEGGDLKSSWFMNWTDSDDGVHSYGEMVIAVQAAAPTSFFGVLISDAESTGNQCGSYWMDYAGLEGSPSRTSSSNNFAEDGSDVYIEAYPADGYKFVGWYQGDPDRAGGKLYTGEPLTTDRVFRFSAPISLARPYICAVFDVDDSPQGDQVQMWVGNTEVVGPDSSAQGGKVAVKYVPGYDKYPEITAKDGTNFVAGEILPFYKGDECTVYQQADEGYHFVGWYHVNIEWGPGETLAWEGSAISTADSFTYKPGQTVVAGDTEPLRYVCAVFEKDQAVTHTVTFNTHGGTPEPAAQTPADGEKAVKPANPVRTGLYFKGWYTKEPSQLTAGDLQSPFDFENTAITSDMELHAAYYGRMKVNSYNLSNSKEYEGGRSSITNIYEQGSWPATNWSGISVGVDTQVTLTAYPADGYEFVGWSPGFSEADIVNTDTEYTFTFQENTTLYALFREENPVVTHTVSFDPGTGTGTKEPETVEHGESCILPPVWTFTHSNPDRAFYRWSVNGELMDPGNSITVEEDTVVTALWHYRKIQKVDGSLDKSTTEVIGHLILRDTRTGEERTEEVYDEVTGSAFTEPSNPTVNSMITEAKTSASQKAQEYAGEYAVTTVSETVTDPSIKNYSDDRTYTYFNNVIDKAGDYYDVNIIDGSYYHNWKYEVTLVAEYTSEDPSAATVTLHWSSVDGVDLMQPIAIETKPGTRLDDALTAAGIPYDDLFSKEGYADFGYRSLHPFDSFSDENDFYDDCIGCDYVIENSTDIYVVMFKELGAASISVAAPVCGSTDAPAVSVLTGECILDGTPVWCEDADPLVPYEGALKGGIQYLAAIQLDADFHYYFADDAQITVSGGELVSAGPHFAGIGVLVRVAVEHIPGDAVKENEIGATCTEAGSHDEVIYCTGCGAEISRTEVTDPALGHDWGAWEITKEPTETEDGEETRTCTRCPETETRAIPHLSVEYRNTEGDGSSWEKGSTETLRFVFKRNASDETAFSHFAGITVDGNAVGASDYSSESGSVVLTLKAAYLETLSPGQHSLTTMFDDADAVTVSFSVTEKGKNVPKKDTQESPKTGDDTNIVCWVLLLAASVMSILFILIKRRKGRISRTTR